MDQSMKDKLAALRAPLPSKSVSWRVGRIKADATKGQALPYLKPRVIQDLLDAVVGPENWRNSYAVVQLGESSSLMAVIEIFVNGHWVYKSDGAQLDDYGTEKNDREVAIKGVYSDSFKRAAVLWGIGRYLYDFPISWVEINDGKYLASTPRLPMHLLPEAERVADVKPESPTPAKASTPVAATPVVTAPAVVVPAAVAPAVVVPVVVAPAEPPVVATAVQETAVVVAKADAARDDETEAQARAAAAVDAAMTPAPVAPELAAPVAAGSSTELPPGMPEGLSDEQLKTVRGLIEKIAKKLPTTMLRNYVRGPKAAESLPESARTYVLQLLDQADGKAS